jgi:hypothetical protein
MENAAGLNFGFDRERLRKACTPHDLPRRSNNRTQVWAKCGPLFSSSTIRPGDQLLLCRDLERDLLRQPFRQPPLLLEVTEEIYQFR